MKTIISTILALGLASAAAAAPTYRCVHLTDEAADAPFGYPFARANGINDKGVIVGFGGFVQPAGYRSARWGRPPAVIDLGDLAGLGSEANGVNRHGQVVGWSWDAQGTQRPVTWIDGMLQTLPTLGEAAAGEARAVDSKGTVVGYSSLPGNPAVRHATAWRHGRVIDLGAWDRKRLSSRANAIGGQGMVVGEAEVEPGLPHAARWSNGVLADLGTLPGATRSWAHGLNELGTIVGSGTYAGGQDDQSHAVAWHGGGITDLGTLPGHVDSSAAAVNDAGIVVGRSAPAALLQDRAAVWFGLDAPAQDLNSLVDAAGCTDPRGDHWTLSYASGINADGVIAATSRMVGDDGGLRFAAFRLIPR